MFNKDSLEFGLAPSSIRELFEYGKLRKKQIGEDNVFDFSIGNPIINPPKEFNDKLKELLDKDNIHSYTSAIGDEIARNSVVESIKNKYGVSLDKDLVFLICGSASGLSISIKSLSESDDDEFIVFSPYFPDYKVFVRNAGSKMIEVNTDEYMMPDLVDLDKKINEHTKAIIINSPNNPSGVVYDEKMIQSISQLLMNKEKKYNHPIYIISDEPYRELIYDNIKYPFLTKYYNNVIITYSLSKVLSLPGERIGYLIVSPNAEYKYELFNAFKGSARMLGYINAPSLFQHSLSFALNMSVNIDEYNENRNILYNSLKEIGYDCIYPSGAFYMLIKSPIADYDKFYDLAIKHEILIVPTKTFGKAGYFRIAYCVKKEQIINSIPQFKKLFKESKEC